MSLFGLKPVSQRTLLTSPHYKYPAHLGTRLCVFTEFITLQFQPDLKLEDETTGEGMVFANIVKALVECPGIRRIWWGRVAEKQHVVKILVDWITSEDNDVFHTSTNYSEIGKALVGLLQQPAMSTLFDAGGERQGLADSTSFLRKTTAFYQWYLPIDFLDEKIEGSSTYLISPPNSLCSRVDRVLSDYKAIGGGNSATFAFSLEAVPYEGKQTRIFCAVQSWKSIIDSMNYFSHVQQAVIPKQAFAELGQMGTWLGHPEHMDLIRFGCELHKTKHWLGSVTQSEPPSPSFSQLFGIPAPVMQLSSTVPAHSGKASESPGRAFL